MKKKIATFVAYLNSLPEANLGFSPVFMFATAKTFKVPGKFVRSMFLGNARKLSPGKYSANPSETSVSSKKIVKPIKVSKAAKKAARFIGEPAPDTSICLYIATPEEIAQY